MQERKLDIVMSQDEFSGFQQALNTSDKSKITEYIQQYITAHKEHNLLPDDVLTLALIQALEGNSPELMKKILSLPHNSNIIATVDDGGFSPISLVLSYRHTPEIMDPIEDYLKTVGNKLPKVDLTGRTFLDVHAAMHVAYNDFDTVFDNVDVLRERFLQYIYTKKSLDQFGSTFVANFSHKEYENSDHETFFQNWHPDTNEQNVSGKVIATVSSSSSRSPISPDRQSTIDQTQKKRPLEAGPTEQVTVKSQKVLADSSVHTNGNNNTSSASSSSSGSKNVEEERKDTYSSEHNGHAEDSAESDTVNEHNSLSYSTGSQPVTLPSSPQSNFLAQFQEQKIEQFSFLPTQDEDTPEQRSKEEEEADEARQEIQKNFENQISKVNLFEAKISAAETKSDNADHYLDNLYTDIYLPIKPESPEDIISLPNPAATILDPSTAFGGVSIALGLLSLSHKPLIGDGDLHLAEGVII